MNSYISQSSSGSFRMDLVDIWRCRELLYFLVWRDVKVRYKQTVIGTLWTVLQPLITMIIFTVVFGRFARVPSDNLPYSVFAYTALIPWTYFAQALSRSGVSVVGDANLVSKVYFPRLIMPLAAVMTPSVDFLLSFLILLALIAWNGISFTWWAFTLPLFVMLAFATALAMGLWLAPLNVKYRDVSHTLPFLIQIWMYASPVVYPVSMVPKDWRFIYSLNPMAGVIEGFRWALLGKQSPDFSVMLISSTAVIVLLITGMVFFRKMEPNFADMI